MLGQQLCYYGYKIGMEIVCEKGTIRLPLPAEPIIRSRLKVDNEIMDNWAERFPKAYDNELQHWINHLRSIEPTAGPGNKDGFAACCIADAMIASQTSEAEIWYDRRRAWFVHRQIPPLGRYAGRFRRAGQRLSAGADYLLDASTRLSRVGAGHNEGFIEAFALSRPVCAAIRPEASGWTYKAAPSLFDGSPPVLKVQRDFLM